MVLERVGRHKPETAAEFPADPETYQKPMEKALRDQVAADQAFAAQLEVLLARYQEAAQAHAAATGPASQIIQHGPGAIAGPGGVAASTGGIAIGGSVHGDVHTSGQPADDAAETQE